MQRPCHGLASGSGEGEPRDHDERSERPAGAGLEVGVGQEIKGEQQRGDRRGQREELDAQVVGHPPAPPRGDHGRGPLTFMDGLA